MVQERRERRKLSKMRVDPELLSFILSNTRVAHFANWASTPRSQVVAGDFDGAQHLWQLYMSLHIDIDLVIQVMAQVTSRLSVLKAGSLFLWPSLKRMVHSGW